MASAATSRRGLARGLTRLRLFQGDRSPMAVQYQDYYKTLGVSRDAPQDDIQRAYRKLARQYHPDMNKEKGAEERFRLIGEAYEVLKDPQKRKQYNALGATWKAGQEFRPPPGWAGSTRGGG